MVSFQIKQSILMDTTDNSSQPSHNALVNISKKKITSIATPIKIKKKPPPPSIPRKILNFSATHSRVTHPRTDRSSSFCLHAYTASK